MNFLDQLKKKTNAATEQGTTPAIEPKPVEPKPVVASKPKPVIPEKTQVQKEAEAQIKEIEEKEINTDADSIKDITILEGKSVADWLGMGGFIGVAKPEHIGIYSETRGEGRLKIRFLKVINLMDVEKGYATMAQVGKIGYKPGKDAKYEEFTGHLFSIGFNSFKVFPFGVVPTPAMKPTGTGFTYFFTSDVDDFVYTFSVQGAYSMGAVEEIGENKWHSISVEKAYNEKNKKNIFFAHFTVLPKDAPDFASIQSQRELMVKWIAKDIERRKEDGTW